MKNDIGTFEELLFNYVNRIKIFNRLIVDKFKLADIPYNLSGKEFSKIGSILDDEGQSISYRFHGRGCTFVEDGVEVFFNVDTTSKHQIIITEGGFYCFLKSYVPDYQDSEYLEVVMNELEIRGVFMQRKAGELGSFHVNEEWYKAYCHKLAFNGENRTEIDWI